VSAEGCCSVEGAKTGVYLKSRPRPDRYFGEVLAERLDDFTFDELPAQMAAMRGVRPRLYLSEERVKQVRQNVRNDPYYAWMMEKVRHVADVAARKGPPQYGEMRVRSPYEQTWQRQTGNLIPYLAFCCAITRDQNYLEAATHFIVQSMSYKSWGKGDFAGSDLATGHQIFGIALAYDWLYEDLGESMRRRVRELLLRRGGYMFDLFAQGRIFWHDEYLQNHQWVNMTALTAAGLALYDEVEGLDPWILLPLEKMKIVLASLGPDGGSHEGVSYWSYGTEYLLKYMDLARDFLGIDFYRDHPWFSNTAYYRIYAGLPTEHLSRRGRMLSFGDSSRRETYGPDYHLRKLAREYRIPQAQWLADVLDKANLTTRKASWLNLLWYDPTVAPAPPVTLPAFRHFEDIGLVFLRSDWSGRETMSMFKCGPHLGRKVVEKFSFDPGGSHVHPDAGELQIFAFGDPLLVNEGYAFKETALQNTVTVDGVGQIGEGMPWFRSDRLCQEGRGGRILRAEAGEQFDLVIADVAPAYKDEAGLKKFLRHVLYLKPNCWVVVDELHSLRPATFQLYFHTRSPMANVGPATFLCVQPGGSLGLRVLSPADPNARTFKQTLLRPESRRPTGEIDALEISNRRKIDAAVFVTFLEAYPSGAEQSAAVQCTHTEDGFELDVRSKERTWRFTVRPGRSDPSQSIFEPIE